MDYVVQEHYRKLYQPLISIMDEAISLCNLVHHLGYCYKMYKNLTVRLITMIETRRRVTFGNIAVIQSSG